MSFIIVPLIVVLIPLIIGNIWFRHRNRFGGLK